MKKFLSAAAAAVLALTAVTPVLHVQAAAENIVVLGDSIASGYGLSDMEHNYGELIGDYYGASVSNYAVPSYDTEDLSNQLHSGNTQLTSDLTDADTVIISIGGNDLIHYSAHTLLLIAESAGCLKDGYTTADIPDEPTFDEVTSMLDKDKLKTFASSTMNQVTLSSSLATLVLDLTATVNTNNYTRYARVIETQVIPNIQYAVSSIRELNSDADIIVQTIYNPIEFETEYFNANYSGSYAQVLNTLIPRFDSVLQSFSNQLQAAADTDGFRVADVYTAFNSAESVEGSTDPVRYGWYFTRIQEGNKDFHPNQAGHLNIAATIIDLLGNLHEDSGLSYKTYSSLTDKDSYPSAAKETLARVLGDLSRELPPEYTLGDFNEDGLVDANDASAILSSYALLSTGELESLTDQQKASGDVNTDELVDSNDASLILSYYAVISTGEQLTLADYVAQNQ